MADGGRVINPCGKIVDVVRSCYKVNMVFWPGGDPIQVKWFFTEKDAEILSSPNLFNSRNWEDDRAQVFDLGEQPGPRQWVNGKKPFCLKGNRNCGFSSQFENGMEGPFSPPLTVTTEGVPKCCCGCPKAVINPPSQPNAVFIEACGGIAIGGQSTVSEGAKCWDCATSNLTCTSTLPSNTFNLIRDFACHWIGGDFPVGLNGFELDCGGSNGAPEMFFQSPGQPPFLCPLLSWNPATQVAVFQIPAPFFPYHAGTTFTVTL